MSLESIFQLKETCWDDLTFIKENVQVCGICLEDGICENTYLCNHSFHPACLERWTQKHSTCPLCRMRINDLDYSSYSSYSTTDNEFMSDYGLYTDSSWTDESDEDEIILRNFEKESIFKKSIPVRSIFNRTLFI